MLPPTPHTEAIQRPTIGGVIYITLIYIIYKEGLQRGKLGWPHIDRSYHNLESPSAAPQGSAPPARPNMRLSTNLVVALFCGCQGLLFWNFSPRFPSPTFGRSVRSAGPTSSSSHDAATTKAKEALESRAGAAHGRLSSYPQTDDVSSVVKATAVQEARPGIPKHTASKENGGRLCQVIDAATFSSSRYVDARGASGDANVCCVRKRTSKTKPFIIHLHCNPSELTRAVLANGLWENGITARMTSVLQR